MLLLFLSNTHIHVDTYNKNSMHAYRHTNVPPSRNDMSLALCPLEIPGDVNPTPVSEPISKYTHRPAHREHMQTHWHSPLCHSLSPARLFSHHRHSPFPVISVPSRPYFSTFPIFSLCISHFQRQVWTHMETHSCAHCCFKNKLTLLLPHVWTCALIIVCQK